MVFASDSLPTPRSYRRSKLLIFINYLEVVFGFVQLHMVGQYFNKPLTPWTAPVHFRFMITSTLASVGIFRSPASATWQFQCSPCSISVTLKLFISFFDQGFNHGYFEKLNKRASNLRRITMRPEVRMALSGLDGALVEAMLPHGRVLVPAGATILKKGGHVR